MGWLTGVQFLAEAQIFFITLPRPVLGPIQPPWVKWPRHEADNSPPFSVMVKNTWNNTSTSTHIFMEYCLIKHREDFTLPERAANVCML